MFIDLIQSLAIIALCGVAIFQRIAIGHLTTAIRLMTSLDEDDTAA